MPNNYKEEKLIVESRHIPKEPLSMKETFNLQTERYMEEWYWKPVSILSLAFVIYSPYYLAQKHLEEWIEICGCNLPKI